MKRIDVQGVSVHSPFPAAMLNVLAYHSYLKNKKAGFEEEKKSD